MYDYIINELYKLRFTPMCTPLNLIDNAKLANYDYVKFKKSRDEKHMEAEMCCLCSDGVKRVFVYMFDKRDWLMEIHIIDEHMTKVFSRDDEIDYLIEEYERQKNKLTDSEAG